MEIITHHNLVNYITENKPLITITTLIVLFIFLIYNHFKKQNLSYFDKYDKYKKAKLAFFVSIPMYFLIHSIVFYMDNHKTENPDTNQGIYKRLDR